MNEVVVQLVEAAIPDDPLLFEPGAGQFETLRSEAVGTDSSGLPGFDQPAIFENAEVLEERGERHGEGAGQFGDGGWAGSEALNDGATGGVGESVKDAGQLGYLLVRQLP